MFNTREDIIAVLTEVDSNLKQRNEKLTIFIVGYSAIVMDNNNNRGSNDIDVIYDRFSTVLRQQGLEVFNEGYFHFHPNYKSRLKPVDEGFTHLSVFYTDPHDIFLLKLDAFREKDKSDLRYMIEHHIVDLKELDQLFIEWNKHWYESNPEVAKNYAKVRE